MKFVQDALMHSSTAPVTLRASSGGIGARLLSLVQRPLSILRRERPDPARIAVVSDVVATQPALRQWLLIIASEPARARHALLARAVQEMRNSLCNPEVADDMEQLADEPLLRAVTETLYRRSGMEPPTEHSGSAARVRLAELGERLQQRESSFIR